jgi:putative NADH-flavin reductase
VGAGGSQDARRGAVRARQPTVTSPRRSTTPRVAIFGATGRTGRRVLARLLALGWQVRLLVRQSERLDFDTHARLGANAVLEGDARDAELVSAALAGAEVVVSALGMHDVAEPASDLSDSLRTIVGTMPAAGAGRIVVVGCAAALPGPRGGFRTDGGDGPAALRHVWAEHRRQYEVLRDAPLEWTLLCPTHLVADVPPGGARTAVDTLPAGSDVTGLDDLAEAIVAEVIAPHFTGHRVGIVSAAR